MKRYINEGLSEFLENNPIVWHMPGHKRKNGFTKQISCVDRVLETLYTMDVTEVPGTDDLHEPEGMILASLNELKNVYGTKYSSYMVNGATGGIQSAIYATKNAVKSDEAGKILIAKNCHKSVYNCADFLKLDAVFVEPEKYFISDNKAMFMGHINPKQVEEICNSENVFAMVLSSPSYEGVVSDIKAIADILHRNGGILIVDEAHGAHLPFMSRWGFPESAISCGADIVVQSLHKTLPSMTQSAIIHVSNEELVSYVKEALQVFMSSSPSYPMLCSMENAIAWACDYDYTEYNNLLKDFRNSTESFKIVEVLSERDVLREGAFAYDNSRIVVTTKEHKISGKVLADFLRKEYNLLVEMVGRNYLVLISTVADNSQDFEALKDSLEALDKYLYETYGELVDEFTANVGAADGYTNSVIDMIKKLEGTIAENNLYVYPPGSYIVRRGELITDKHIDELTGYAKAGLNIRGL